MALSPLPAIASPRAWAFASSAHSRTRATVQGQRSLLFVAAAAKGKEAADGIGAVHPVGTNSVVRANDTGTV